MKKLLFLLLILTLAGSVSSCWTDKSKPNFQYMPDMYKPVGYETYSENPNFENGMTTQLPVKGTIPRGAIPYEYENNEQAYLLAKKQLTNPLPKNEENLAAGKALYTIYCTSCHGKKGDGYGTLVEREKFLGVPNFKDRDITEGSIYHVIMHGRNLMGSHASQLTQKERWQVTDYVQKLRGDLLKN
jgi:mono/diheme cytochrome c family protein